MSEKREKNLVGMVSSLIDDFFSLVKGHLELAKVELQEAVVGILKSTGFVIVAFLIGWFALLFLFVAGALGISACGLPLWAGFLIMTGVMSVLVAFFLYLGARQVKRVKANRRSFESLNKTAEMFRDLS